MRPDSGCRESKCPKVDACTPEEPLCGSWLDFDFLGKRIFDVYIATLRTANTAFFDEIEKMASNRAWAMLTPEEQRYEAVDSHEFIPCAWDRNGKVTRYSLEFKPDVLYPQFGGLSIYDYERQLEREIMNNEPPEVYECFDLDYSYPYGFGLHITLDVKTITIPVVERAIDRFFELDLKPWRAEKPIPREKLPYKWYY
jgi:hypothetical protein